VSNDEDRVMLDLNRLNLEGGGGGEYRPNKGGGRGDENDSREYRHHHYPPNHHDIKIMITGPFILPLLNLLLLTLSSGNLAFSLGIQKKVFIREM